MAGNVVAGELIRTRRGGVAFDVATERDDAAIRRLLRDNPMGGRVSLSLEREPSCFVDAGLPEETKHIIVARENGRVVCAGHCTIRPRHINGRPRRVGYLGGLRLAAGQGGRFDILRRGYEFFRELQDAASAEFYFTSIASDNHRARRFLERGLPGLPEYELAGEFVTVALPTGKAPQGNGSGRGPHVPSFEEIADLLNRHQSAYQFSPCWSDAGLAALQTIGLTREDFLVHDDPGQPPVCAALWDQRSFKQTVVRGYAPGLARLRPVLNAVARCTGGPRLPDPGEPLALGYVSHLGVPVEDSSRLVRMLDELRRRARSRGLRYLALGFDANDPRLAAVRAGFRGRLFHNRLYVVRWPDRGASARELDARILAPEAALL
jgi:hypothetical protein